MLRTIKSIYGIEDDLTEEQALEMVRVSLETNRHLCRLVSALRAVKEAGSPDQAPEKASPEPPGIEIDSPAEALHVLVETNELSRADADQLTPILLGMQPASPRDPSEPPPAADRPSAPTRR